LAIRIYGVADDPGFGIHTCRHTCASRLASKRVCQGGVIAWGGSSSHAAVQRCMPLGIDVLGSCVAALEDP